MREWLYELIETNPTIEEIVNEILAEVATRNQEMAVDALSPVLDMFALAEEIPEPQRSLLYKGIKDLGDVIRTFLSEANFEARPYDR